MISGDKQKRKKSKGSNKIKVPKIQYTPFRSATDRLSMAQGILDIYDYSGSLYTMIPRDPADTSKWTFQYDDVEEKEENHYGRAVNSGGDPNGDSEISPDDPATGKPWNEFPGSVSSKISDSGSNANANRAHAAHERFKFDMDDSMRRNGFNPVGMLNDTKRKEIIDLIATDKNKNIDQFLNNSSKSKKFKKNSSVKYEKRYDKNKTYLNNKKLPNYKSGSRIKDDEYNKLYPISDTITDVDSPQQTWKNWDFIPFILHDLVNKKYLPFRSFINSISDQSDAEWQDIKYLGRADAVQVYSGFTRTLSIDFTTVAFTLEELHPMWQRLNYLVGLTKPANYTTYAEHESVIPTSSFIIPPFIKFNLGDMYVDQPCVMTSVALSIPPEASWELTSDKKSKNKYEYMNGTVTRNKILVAQYPDMASISLSFKLLEKRMPKTNNRHFGHYVAEDSLAITDHGPDGEYGFNYNLIYPNPNNPEKNITETPNPTDDPGDPDILGKDGDPFEGGVGSCTTYPPSHYKILNGTKTKKDEDKIASELLDWKDCACKELARLMNQVPADSQTPSTEFMADQLREVGTEENPFCTWTASCISSVNGVSVPPALRCIHSTTSTEDPETEDTNPKPDRCPSPVGESWQSDGKGRPIGPPNRLSTRAERRGAPRSPPSSEEITKAKYRNLEYWIRDLSDYFATELKSPKIGSPPYTYNQKSGNVPPPFELIKSASSSNGSVVIEFDADGHPFSYAGRAIDPELSKEFKINCADEDPADEIREIAGNIQPKILVDLNHHIKQGPGGNQGSGPRGFRIIIDEDKNHVITKDNFEDIPLIKKWLSAWVGKEMRKLVGFQRGGTVAGTNRTVGSLQTTSSWDESYFNLSGEWARGSVITQQELHYIPYESDPEKMIDGLKMFPEGDPDYVDYQVDTDVADKLDLNHWRDVGKDLKEHKLAELKFGFYALVSKEQEKLSQRPSEIRIESDLADRLYDILIDQNVNALKYPKRGLPFGSDGGTKDGEDLTSDEGLKRFIDPTEDIRQEIALLNERINKESRLIHQLLDENIPCHDYSLVGKWNPTQANAIMTKMRDPEWQSVISEKTKLGISRISLENYMLIVAAPEVEDVETADALYSERANKGKLKRVDPVLEQYSDIDWLRGEINRLAAVGAEQMKEREQAEKDERVATRLNPSAAAESPTYHQMPHGVHWVKRSSEDHYIPWVRDHKLNKIRWPAGTGTGHGIPSDPSRRRKSKERKEDIGVAQPNPSTETPTPNKKPKWKWDAVKNATKYEVEFGGEKTLTSNVFYESKSELKPGSYEIKVRASAPTGTGPVEWSTQGTHTVTISPLAIPPKPPKCPYKVLGVGAEDQYGRLIGLKTEDEPMESAIERNVLMWMGDVMAYILAKEELGFLEHPVDPSSVSWSSKGHQRESTTVVGRHSLKWTYSGDVIHELKEDVPGAGTVIELNGTSLLSARNGLPEFRYIDVFVNGCEGDVDDTEPPSDEELKTPQPTSRNGEETKNSQPTWYWAPIHGANAYTVSLREVKDGATKKNFGIIQMSSETDAFPPMALEPGEYEIQVIAEKQDENNHVVKKSKPGTHIVSIISKTICDKMYPQPEQYLENQRGYCPTRDESAKIKWWTNALKWMLCRYDEDSDQPDRTHTIADGSVEVMVHPNHPKPHEGFKDYDNPEKVTSQHHPSYKNDDHQHIYVTQKESQGGSSSSSTGVFLRWSDVHSYWEEGGFTLTDPGKTTSCTGGVPKPPDCPYPVGGAGETDSSGRLIGINPGETPMVIAPIFAPKFAHKSPIYVEAIKRNVQLWCGDLIAWLVQEFELDPIERPKSSAEVGLQITLTQSSSSHKITYAGHELKLGSTPSLYDWQTEGALGSYMNIPPLIDKYPNWKRGMIGWHPNTPRELDGESIYKKLGYEVAIGFASNYYWCGQVFTDEPDEPDENPSLSPPTPTTKTPTDTKKVTWSWPEVKDATKYEVSLSIVKPSEEGSTTGPYEVVTGLGVLAEDSETKFEFSADNDGYYEISVIAKNETLASDPGKHVVHIDTDTDTSPCPPKPSQYMSESPEVCQALRAAHSLERTIAVKEAEPMWKLSVYRYMVCKATGNPDWTNVPVPTAALHDWRRQPTKGGHTRYKLCSVSEGGKKIDISEHPDNNFDWRKPIPSQEEKQAHYPQWNKTTKYTSRSYPWTQCGLLENCKVMYKGEEYHAQHNVIPPGYEPGGRDPAGAAAWKTAAQVDKEMSGGNESEDI